MVPPRVDPGRIGIVPGSAESTPLAPPPRGGGKVMVPPRVDPGGIGIVPGSAESTPLAPLHEGGER
jgi:hypothetical protein